jgi:CheY-like chemotaxis protein
VKGLIGPQLHPKEERRNAPAHRPHILVVDDDPMSCKLLSLNLRGAGYSVTTAEDAVAAGHRIVEQLPDLVIADYKMPYMNGVDFVAALRADSSIPDLPVIFITAAENKPEIAGRTFGFPLLTKPLSADELLATVAAQLGARAA